MPELCWEHGISNVTFYTWRSKYGGMDAYLMARLKELEEESRRLKKMYAEEMATFSSLSSPLSEYVKLNQ